MIGAVIGTLASGAVPFEGGAEDEESCSELDSENGTTVLLASPEAVESECSIFEDSLFSSHFVPFCGEEGGARSRSRAGS